MSPALTDRDRDSLWLALTLRFSFEAHLILDGTLVRVWVWNITCWVAGLCCRSPKFSFCLTTSISLFMWCTYYHFFATISITEFLCKQLAVVFLLCCSGQWAGGHGLSSSFVPMGLSFQMRCTEHACYHLALTMQISKKICGKWLNWLFGYYTWNKWTLWVLQTN